MLMDKVAVNLLYGNIALKIYKNLDYSYQYSIIVVSDETEKLISILKGEQMNGGFRTDE